MTFEELLPLYVLDAVDPAEREIVETHLRLHPEDMVKVFELQADVDVLNQAASSIDPSPRVKDQLLARIGAQGLVAQNQTKKSNVAPVHPRPVRQPVRDSWWDRFRAGFALPVFAGVAAVTAVVACLWVSSLRQQLNQQDQTVSLQQAEIQLLTEKTAALEKQVVEQADVAALEQRIAALEASANELQIINESLRKEIEQQDTLLAIFQSPEISTTQVVGTDVQPQAIGNLTTNVSSETAVFNSWNLQPIDSTLLTYQLWIITDDGPTGVGLFEPDENGLGSVTVSSQSVANYNAIGVTLEPVGGSELPTSDIIMLGQ